MYSLTLFLLALFTFYIAAFGFVRWDSTFLRAGDMPAIRLLLIGIGVLFLFYGLYLIYRRLNHCQKPVQKLAKWGMLGLILAGQLGFLLYFRPILRYDALKTFDQAVEMLSTHTISPTYENGYFARYTNNYPITIFTYQLLSLASSLGLPADHYMLFVQLLNVGLLDLSLLLGSGIVTCIRKEPSANLLYLLLCAACPATYVWAGFYYTSTLSMPFFMGALLLFFQMRQKNDRFQPARTFLLVFLLLMGYKFRATTLIALIAIGIAAFCSLQKQIRSHALRPLLVNGAAFMLSCALTLGLWSAAVNHYVRFDYKNTGFPAIHWVMMGMRWDGAFDQSDELYTYSFPTKEEKVSADLKLLTERVKEAGPGGMLSLMGRKLLNTWVDGTDTYEAENSACQYGRLYEYLLGNKDGLLVIYAQVFRVLQMLVLGAGALLILFSWRRFREQTPAFVLQLSLLGAMAFHLIWETNPLYSIGFLFLTLVLMADQLLCIWKVLEIRNFLAVGRISLSAGLACLLVLLILGQKQLVETPIEENLYRVHQYQDNDNDRTYIQEYEEVYTQTFVTDQPFNRLAIHALNPVGEYNQSAFCVSIADEKGNLVYDNDRFLSGMVEKNKWYVFSFDLVVPEEETTYTITLWPGYIHGEDSLQLLYYHTGNQDLYPQGTLTIAGEEQKNGDLAFAVYEYQVTTYFNQKVYILLALVLLLLCGGIVWGIWRYRPSTT
ncbi:MAG: hypothetical protein HFI33_10440 [Lachnospiraceae bacterium]|nr:hypothetical protein [Lachnospiraceae bacterium]